ncbi:synaptic vesicle glycoprotein 2B-like [Contarinia nasturtii]|uniref:synaptic vesicle glycoprotein 2B-like n=1 Tax=Contarinia nasturtii TaxID=265458 RepID=UPI0012D47F28|nr:synaptic vesicle glycoprotein 2B-like [Contarinia nasturtii]
MKSSCNFDEKRYTLDEAIEIAGHGKFNVFIILISGIVMLGAGVETVTIAFVLPFVNCDLNMTTTQKGLATSIQYLGIIISSHFWGVLCDTWGRAKVIKLAAMCAFISATLSAFSVNATVLIFLRFIIGIFISGLQASVFSYVSEFHTRTSAPRAASFVSIFMPVIYLYASIIGYFVIPMNWQFDIYFINFVPWRLFLILLALVNAAIAITFIFMPETPKFLLTMNEHDESVKVLRQMYAINTGNSKEMYPVVHLIPEAAGNSLTATKGFLNILKLVWNQTKPIFVVPYLDSTLKLCFLMFTLFAIGHGLTLWFPYFLNELQNNMDSSNTLCGVIGHKRVVSTSNDVCNADNSNTTIYQVMFFIGLTFTILSTLISIYLDKISPRILVPIWLVLSATCSVALNVLTDFYSIVGTFITFQSCCICATIISAISVSLFPTNVRAMATCFIYMFGRIGGLVGTNLVGVMVEHDCSLIFNVFGALTLTCAFVFLFVKSKMPEPIQKVQRNDGDGSA